MPSPTREPDGSWSSPLTPKPSRRPLDPTQARYGRAGGPGFQPTRTDQPGSQSAGTEGLGLSPWQRSHQIWTEAGIEWERRPAPQLPWRPTGSRSAAWPAAARQVSPARPAAPPRPEHAPQPGYAPQPEYAPRPEHAPQPEYAPRPEQTPWPDSYVAAGWPGRTPVPLGAPVYSEPGVDEDDDPARDDGWGDDRWADDRPPILQRPPGLISPDEPDEMPDGDTLLFGDRPLGSRRAGSRQAGSRQPG